MASVSTVFRDYVVDGNPGSGIWNPQKSDIRSLFAGAFLNNPTTVNANYSIQTGDAGNTIAVTGSASVTLTYGSPGSFASTHANIVVNLSSRRASIDITSSGGGVVWVWPGCFAIVCQISSAWVAIANSARFRLTGGGLYVDAVYGLDTNDGLAPGSGGARQTITAAVKSYLADIDFAGNQSAINIAAGTYTESLTVSAYPVGLAEVFFFQGASAGSVIWKPGAGQNFCCIVADGGTCEMSNITFDNTGGVSGAVAVQVHQTGIIDLNNGITYGNFVGGVHLSSDANGGNVNIGDSYTISGTAFNHALIGRASLNIAGNINVNIPNTLTGMNQFFQVAGGAVLMGGGISFTGAGAGTAQPGGQWQVLANGWISKSGNTIPGNAGSNSVTTGGQVF